MSRVADPNSKISTKLPINSTSNHPTTNMKTTSNMPERLSNNPSQNKQSIY